MGDIVHVVVMYFPFRTIVRFDVSRELVLCCTINRTGTKSDPMGRCTYNILLGYSVTEFPSIKNLNFGKNHNLTKIKNFGKLKFKRRCFDKNRNFTSQRCRYSGSLNKVT